MENNPTYRDPVPEVKVLPGRPVLLDCPNCGQFISAIDVDLEQKKADCSNCGHQFMFEDQVKEDPHRRPEMIIPDSVDALPLRSKLEIVLDWYRAAPKKSVATLVTGTFLWNIILLPIVFFLAYTGNFLIMIFLMGHLATGFVLLAQLISLFVNKTHITVDSTGISMQTSPIKSLLHRDKQISAEQIKQLYVVRYTEKYHKKNQRGVQAYALYAILYNNKTIELVRGMDRETQLYLEQEIERYLDIKDLPVRGELER